LVLILSLRKFLFLLFMVYILHFILICKTCQAISGLDTWLPGAVCMTSWGIYDVAVLLLSPVAGEWQTTRSLQSITFFALPQSIRIISLTGFLIRPTNGWTLHMPGLVVGTWTFIAAAKKQHMHDENNQVITWFDKGLHIRILYSKIRSDWMIGNGILPLWSNPVHSHLAFWISA
jgi:hypothetical protein